MYFDSHVHLRDFNERHKETIKHGMEVARDSGVDAVLDMPNPDPAIVSVQVLMDRLRAARDSGVKGVFYGAYIGVTNDREQVKRAISMVRNIRQAVGIKMYAGHSVRNLGLIRQDDRRMVYETMGSEGYGGVFAVHCEMEECMDHKLWTPREPLSHCLARPEAAEVASVREQISFAKEYGFRGKLHIVHVSAPAAVELVSDAKASGLDISCGVCPHHFIYDWQQMLSPKGVFWKMNPPLREPESRDRMFQYLRDGKIDFIETDHAPHSLEEKLSEPFASGIPGLAWWPVFEEYLRRHEFSDIQIEKLTFSNAVERFGLPISRSRRKIVDRRKDYPFDPYLPMQRELGWR